MTENADVISRNVSPQNPRNPFQISPSCLVTPLVFPAECKQFFNAHFADAPPPPERCFEGWGGWQCTNETYFLPKHRNLFRKKVGFQAESLCFGQNYSVFGVSVSFFSVRNGIKWPKCRNSETENETVRTLVHNDSLKIALQFFPMCRSSY